MSSAPGKEQKNELENSPISFPRSFSTPKGLHFMDSIPKILLAPCWQALNENTAE